MLRVRSKHAVAWPLSCLLNRYRLANLLDAAKDPSLRRPVLPFDFHYPGTLPPLLLEQILLYITWPPFECFLLMDIKRAAIIFNSSFIKTRVLVLITATTNCASKLKQ